MKYLSGSEIKKSFIEFFEAKNHRQVPSASLIPQGDKTILFTNSGMNQFKDIFLGAKEIKEKRVCDYQKCIRLSGKHNDLEEVGWDSYHHTFFEMLGNWSFGDYYKKEAIKWAWELLTEVWELPKEKLFATVYYKDEEALNLWATETDIQKNNILKFDEKDNFWEMADVGPCGPCSEIHIDLGLENCTCKEQSKREACKEHGGGVNQDCARYIEIWNLVFIQYNRNSKGELSPLEKVHVDTGMGFERICRVLQGKKSNYDTDVFSPIIKALEEKTGLTYEGVGEGNDPMPDVAFRVIADHIRTIFLSIADGVIPSNEGRGYVIRRVLRRAFRYGKTLGLEAPFLFDLCRVVPQILAEHYPDLTEKLEAVKKIILAEEELFITTLNKGLILFDKLVEKTKGSAKDSEVKKISGKDTFVLYDTYGFPFDLIKLLAKENDLEIDEKEFEAQLSKQKEKSRSQKKIAFDTSLLTGLGATEYLESPHASAGESDKELHKLLMVVKKDQRVESCSASQSTAQEGLFLIFDKSKFYGESGGQVGDQGLIYSSDKQTIFEVKNTLKENKVIIIYGQLVLGEIKEGESYYQEIDEARRKEITKNHTATHLLQQALINQLGGHIKQAGSLIDDEKLRFDFNHSGALTEQEKLQVEKEVNQKIIEGIPRRVEILEYKKAMAEGARAFFDEKYEDEVRVVTFGDYSKELCGGSHVVFTSQIGGFKILSETGVSSGVRRIEAITGRKNNDLDLANERLVKQVSQLLNVSDQEQVIEKITQLKNSLDKTKLELFKAQKQSYYSSILQDKVSINSFSFLAYSFSDEKPLLVEELVDGLKKYPYNIVFFVNKIKDKLIYFIGVGSKAREEGVKANLLLSLVNEKTRGKGGGSPTFARGGSGNILPLEEIIEAVYQEVKTLVKDESV